MFGIGAIGLAVVAPHVPAGHAGRFFAIPLFVMGCGQGALITPNQTLALMDVDPVMGSTAGGVLQTGQRIGLAIGQAVIGAVFFSSLSGTGHAAYSDALGNAVIVAIVFVAIAVAIGVHDLVTRPSPPTVDTVRARDGPAGTRAGGCRSHRRADRRRAAPRRRRPRLRLGPGRRGLRRAGRGVPDDRRAGVPGTDRRGASRHASRRTTWTGPRCSCSRGAPISTRVTVCAPVVHGVRTAAAAGLHARRADQRQRVPAARPRGRSGGAGPRPPEPHRHLTDRGRALRRPHRLLVAPPACARTRARPDAGGGDVRLAAGTALRDARRGRVGTPDRWRRARDVDRPGGDRGKRMRAGGARTVDGHRRRGRRLRGSTRARWWPWQSAPPHGWVRCSRTW